MENLAIVGVINNGGSFKPKIQSLVLGVSEEYLISTLVVDGQGNAYDISSGDLILSLKQSNIEPRILILEQTAKNTGLGLATFTLSSEQTSSLDVGQSYMYDVVFVQGGNTAHVIPVSLIIPNLVEE